MNLMIWYFHVTCNIVKVYKKKMWFSLLFALQMVNQKLQNFEFLSSF